MPGPKSRQDLTTVRTVSDLRSATQSWRQNGETLALVPTMGALHEGHITLVERALDAAQHVVVSIFVNPTQFAPNEDLDRYPRDEAGDLDKLRKLGVELVWAPTKEAMYPEGFSTSIKPGSAAEGLETDHRPHFFGGVATVVGKLFNQVRPDFAVFGEKDYQQLIVVTQLARDLDMGLEILPVETVREEDGLALSSRNAYLSERERAVAPNLNLVLNEIANAVAAGASVPHLKTAAAVRLTTLGFTKVDYVEVRDAKTLEPFDPKLTSTGRVLGAAWLGKTRLIDNIPVPD
ncbi:MAG: pantoate--beta-alanine ligase [Filomicrobium sp.]